MTWGRTPKTPNPFKTGDKVVYLRRDGKLQIPATVVRPAGSTHVSLRFEMPVVINSGRKTMASQVAITQVKRVGDGKA